MLPDTMQSASQLLERAGVRAAMEHILATDDQTLTHQIGLTEIPAPPFGEETRGRRMAELLDEAGLANVQRDAVGNVFALRPGTEDRKPLVLSAHLDTVFPVGTDVTVRADGDLLQAPGVSDDARGLAALVTLARALSQAGITTRLPILFAATVGEEGSGDLRGVRHLFEAGGAAAGGGIYLFGRSGNEVRGNERPGSTALSGGPPRPGGTLVDRLGRTQSHSRARASGRRFGVVAYADRSGPESHRSTVGRRDERQRDPGRGLGRIGFSE